MIRQLGGRYYVDACDLALGDVFELDPETRAVVLDIDADGTVTFGRLGKLRAPTHRSGSRMFKPHQVVEVVPARQRNPA